MSPGYFPAPTAPDPCICPGSPPSEFFSELLANGGYRQAISEALPYATQVTDRWHLLQNASDACLAAVRRAIPAIRRTVCDAELDPGILTSAERLQFEGFKRRQKTNVLDPADGCRRRAYQADRPGHWSKPRPGSARPARRTGRRLQATPKQPNPLVPAAWTVLAGRMSQWR